MTARGARDDERSPGLAEPSVLEEGSLRYLLAVPPRAADEPWPLLCFLHGYDEAAPLEIGRALTRHGPLRPGSWPGARERFVVVAPQLPTAGDLWHRHADAVAAIVTRVLRAHGGDPARCYLTGFSFGGNGVLDLALRQPDRWAALWPVDPTRVPSQPIAPPIWLSIGGVARHGQGAFVRALALRDAGQGPEVPADDRLHLDQGADHVGSATLTYADERIYRWLLARRLGDPATTTSA